MNTHTPVISTPSALEIAFTKIASTGHRKPKLTIEGYTFKRAPDHGNNAGAVYVTDTYGGMKGNYLGKIINNMFFPVVATDPLMLDTIHRVMNEPQAEAIKWGRETGECAVCGRRLDNKVSIALGIGPICNENFGWALPAAYGNDDDIGEL